MTLPLKLKPARSYPANVVHYVRGRFKQGALTAADYAAGKQNMPIDNTQVHIGTIPRGAFVGAASVHVVTLFDGTTPAMNVGTKGTANGFIPTAAIAPGTAGFKANLATGTLLGAQAAADDVPVYVQLNAAGNAAGEVDIVLPFVPTAD